MRVRRALNGVVAERRGGRVTAFRAGAVVARGLAGRVGIGDSCSISLKAAAHGTDARVLAEVVAFDNDTVTLTPYAEPEGIVAGADVAIEPAIAGVYPHASWRGRVVDAFGTACDGGPPLEQGRQFYPARTRALPASRRRALGPRLDLGVRALDLFTPCCEGQRLGIFAGSGVGKSTLLSMIAKATAADLLVIGLIGERGRELNEFLTQTLGTEGRARSIVVVATSDEPAMQRRRAAQTTLAIAEAFRDDGLRVLCLIDSVTRVATALREIYLAAGEVPTTRGYPPGVFKELPQLLERAGPGEGEGSITGLFTVLVEGDDTNEPVADTVRGILDGHVVLSRSIAEGGRFPAIDVLRSISRTTPGCYEEGERAMIRAARRSMQTWSEMAEMVQLGAYRAGANAEVDRAVALRPKIEAVLQQEITETSDRLDAFDRLGAVFEEVP